MERISRGRCIAVAVALVASLVITACGKSNEGGTQENTGSTSAAAASTPTEQPQPQFGRPFTANPNIVGARPIPFESWSRLAPDRIAVNFQTGAPECYGVDATVTETDTAVTIELRSGTLPEAVGRVCVMIAVFGTLEIQLKAPLGDRKVLSAV